MSKERCEDMKNSHLRGIHSLSGTPWVSMLEKDLLELVKQNKKLRKSIAFYSSVSCNAHLERLLDRSEKQIKRYREALEQIANSDGWLIEPNPLCTIEEAYERCVDVAIEALEGREMNE